MSKIKELIFRSDFTKNVTVLMSGNGLALIFPFLVAPLISRLYTPADFAGFELFIKIAMLVAVISSLRFEMAILMPRSDDEADDLLKMSIKILFITSLISLLIAWPFRTEISELLDNNSISGLLWFLPLAVLAVGGQQILTQYVIRLQKFKAIASNKVLGAISNNGLKYMLGLFRPTSASLVIGQIAGHLLPIAAFLGIKRVRQPLKSLFSQTVPSKKLFKKYKDFPLINSAHAFFDEGQKALLLFIISAYFGEIVLGLFAFAWRYLRVPLQVFGYSLSQVLNEKWARELERGVLIKSSYLRTVLSLFALGVIPFGVLFFFGEPIFKFVFGADWTKAGLYSAYMAPWLLFNFVVSPISYIPVLYDRQKTSFLLAVTGNLIILSVAVIMAKAGYEFKDVLMAIVGLNCLHLLVALSWIYSLTLKRRQEI